MLEALVTATVLGLIGFAGVYAILALPWKPGPSTRCWLWRLVLLKFAISLVVVWPAPILPATGYRSASSLEHVIASEPAPSSGVQAVASRTEAWPSLLIAIWFAGAATALLTRKWIPKATNTSTPYVAGLLRPRMYIPEGLAPAERELVSLHERAHIARGDLQWSALLTLVACTFWFLPPAWWALRWSKEEAELACDELVMSHKNVSPATYAALLVRFATTTSSDLALGMATNARILERRLEAMKKPRRRYPLFALALVPLALALIPWRATAQEPEATPVEPTGIEIAYMNLLGRPEVKAELGITTEQEKEFEAASAASLVMTQEHRKRLDEQRRMLMDRDKLAAWDQRERPKMFFKAHVNFIKVLTPSQGKRFKEIVLQYAGGMALLDPSIGNELNFTTEQRKFLDEAWKGLYWLQEGTDMLERPRSSLLKANRANRMKMSEAEVKEYSQLEQKLFEGRGDEAAIRKRLKEISDKYNLFDIPVGEREVIDALSENVVEAQRLKSERARFALGQQFLSMLSPEQVKKFKEMQGKPFVFSTSAFGTNSASP
jgi:Zn-dependent protease with chaperone function